MTCIASSQMEGGVSYHAASLSLATRSPSSITIFVRDTRNSTDRSKCATECLNKTANT